MRINRVIGSMFAVVALAASSTVCSANGGTGAVTVIHGISGLA